MKLIKNKDEEPKKKKKHLSKAKKQKLRVLKKEEKNKKKEEKKNKESKLELRSFFGGIAVGIANIIPGISGGTMMVIFGLFDKLAYSISDIFKKKTDTRKQSIIFVLKVLIGVAVGLVGFAKILGYTLDHMEAETIFWFMGLIIFSIPLIYNKEMKNEKFNIVYFLIGVAVIGILEYFNLHGGISKVTDDSGFMNMLILFGLGIIGGVTMIFPGISGSMIMLVLGRYDLLRGYVADITKFDMNIYFKLGIVAVGALIGIVVSSKILTKLLKNHKGKTMSLILGFIIASAVILPMNLENEITFTTEKICGLIVAFVLGGIVIYYINKLEKNSSD